MITIIDGDIVSFSCAIYNEEYGWEAARSDIDNMMQRILETTGATEYEVYISGANNFRYDVDPDYKANRKGKVDPIYRQAANAHLVTEFGGRVTDGYEADDAIGISATQHGSNCIIASIDKDLMQIPGTHYNWRKNEFTTINPLDGLRRFYCSLLTGDRTDNIPGVGGIGPVKSARIINDLESEEDMFLAVESMYSDQKRLLMNGQLLYLLRHENDSWVHHYERLKHLTQIEDEGIERPLQE